MLNSQYQLDHYTGQPITIGKKGDDDMPWYMYPIITCRVLNRIANRHPRASIQDLSNLLDNATQLLWRKQEHYIKTRSSYNNNFTYDKISLNG